MMHHHYSHLIQGDDDVNFHDLNYGHHNNAINHHNNLMNSIDPRGFVGAIDVTSDSLHENNLLHMNGLHHHGNNDMNMNAFHPDVSMTDMQILPIIVSEQGNDMSRHPGMNMYSQSMHYQGMHHMQPMHHNTLSMMPSSMMPSSMMSSSMMHHQHQHHIPLPAGYQMLSGIPISLQHHISQNNNNNKPQSDSQSQVSSIDSNGDSLMGRTQSNRSQMPVGTKQTVRRKGRPITPEVKQLILDKNREAQRRYRQNLSEEKRLATLEKNRQAHKRFREHLTPEAQSLCREKNRLAQRKRRELQSVERKMLAQEKNRQAQRRRRDAGKSNPQDDDNSDDEHDENGHKRSKINSDHQSVSSYDESNYDISDLGHPSEPQDRIHSYSIGQMNMMNGMQFHSTSIPGNIHLEADSMKKFIGTGVQIPGTGSSDSQYSYNFKL